MLFCFFASIRGILLMHLFKFCIVLSLLGFQIELHMLQILKIFVLNLLPKGLLLGPGFLCLPSVLFFDSFNHIVKFLQMVMVGLFHFLSFSNVFLLEYVDIPFEFLHEAVNSGVLDLNRKNVTSNKVSIWMRWLRMAIWY